jgi:hypothetical protein
MSIINYSAARPTEAVSLLRDGPEAVGRAAKPAKPGEKLRKGTASPQSQNVPDLIKVIV